MADVTLTFEVEGVEEVATMFRVADNKASNMSEPLQKSSGMMLKAFDMNFDSHGRTFGEPWKARQKNPGWPLLEHTGIMKHSFDSSLGSNFVVLFNRAPWFKFHQSNKPRSTKLPRRVMMKVDEIRRRQIVKYFQEFFVGGK